MGTLEELLARDIDLTIERLKHKRFKPDPIPENTFQESLA